jgi:hypothetical protein
MSSGLPDSSPSSGSKKAKGMKNQDGREGPQVGPKQAAFNDKKVDSMPNEGAPELTGKGVIAKLI